MDGTWDEAQKTGVVFKAGAAQSKKNVAKLMFNERDAVIGKSTVGLKRLDFTGAEFLVLIIFLLQNSNNCLKTFNFLQFSSYIILSLLLMKSALEAFAVAFSKN